MGFGCWVGGGWEGKTRKAAGVAPAAWWESCRSWCYGVDTEGGRGDPGLPVVMSSAFTFDHDSLPMAHTGKAGAGTRENPARAT